MKTGRVRVQQYRPRSFGGSAQHAGLDHLAADVQARNDQVEQPKSELRVLKVQFLESIIVDHRCLDIALAARRHSAPTIPRE